MALATWTMANAWNGCEVLMQRISGFGYQSETIETDWCYYPADEINTTCMLYVSLQGFFALHILGYSKLLTTV